MRFQQLADAYLSDPDSPFPKLRFVTREGYRRNIERLLRDLSDKEIATMTAREMLRIHAKWEEGGHVATAHTLVTQVRIIVGFGATILEDADCQRLRGVMAGLRFRNAKRRTQFLTAEQATAVRDEAIDKLFLSIALAQAFQQDTALRQKDIIGEWVPLDDPEPSTILSPDGQMKWVRGITREEVNSAMVLTHKTSKRGQVLSFNLAACGAVMEEWFSAPPSGPLIIDPQTDLPYEAWKYRRVWREHANAAGVPKNVWNMDSRSGRITRAFAEGANPDDIRKLAGHQNLSTTMGYSRGSAEAIDRVLTGAKPAPEAPHSPTDSPDHG